MNDILSFLDQVITLWVSAVLVVSSPTSESSSKLHEHVIMVITRKRDPIIVEQSLEGYQLDITLV